MSTTETKIRAVIEKALNGEYRNNGLILQAMILRLEQENIIF